ncbi:MAG: uroporphyrinogen-III synthase [Hyphomicrobiaceae bacterium]|nr:uroporphyrinogen-III synthase [Hyphomicrobiaceae bacterium]
MLILITRPLPDAWHMQSLVERQGQKTLLAPLIEIVPEAIDPAVFEGASGVIVTSQNALRSLHLAGLTPAVRHLQIYAVGEATAKHAFDLKLPNITAGRGTAADLVTPIVERHKTRKGHLVHLAGDHLAFDMKGALAEHGLDVRVVPAYKSVAATALPPEVVGKMKTGQLDAVTLMSPRTAEIWTNLATKHGVRAELDKILHICLSPAVADKLQLGPHIRVETASQPQLGEMLSLIKGLAASTAQE